MFKGAPLILCVCAFRLASGCNLCEAILYGCWESYNGTTQLIGHLSYFTTVRIWTASVKIPPSNPAWPCQSISIDPFRFVKTGCALSGDNASNTASP